MATSKSSRGSMAGGSVIAVSVLAGSLIGAFKQQPTAGFLIGLGIGVVVAIAVWLLGRR